MHLEYFVPEFWAPKIMSSCSQSTNCNAEMDATYKISKGVDNPTPTTNACCYKVTALDNNPIPLKDDFWTSNGYPISTSGAAKYWCDLDANTLSYESIRKRITGIEKIIR